MPRPPALPVGDKLTLVMGVLTGKWTVAQAARRAGVSDQSILNWRRQFIEGGRVGLEPGAGNRVTRREADLLAEVERLKKALGETCLELIVWRNLVRHGNAAITSDAGDSTPASRPETSPR
ncbi:helix-turn-helix domain-containing protein [Nonomuraea typhae]|uniref:helix-turn-helix domain-containing protein n=1 Tax=Nonomuraea typhae TaxID=2603600 RepID=UPI0012F7A707|nr:helix-turn-helix domain-containing protein [Nonomuraea typhae]